jgi:drug/metabolite transporter (DMT)-like permease
MPLWALLIAVCFLGEALTLKKILVALIGFTGVLIIVKPGVSHFRPEILIVLASAFFFATTHVSTKILSRDNPVILIMFLMCVIQACIGGILSLSSFVQPQGAEWVWLFVVGIASFSAHFCLASAMKHTDASTILTLDFLRMPFIAIVGFLLYGEAIDYYVLIGGAVIFTSSILNTIPFMEKKKISEQAA